ncbi:MAG: histidine kinase [Desulfuromonadales bacterium]|nr:histidine kinase [Desulfuromonadales bacterium]
MEQKEGLEFVVGEEKRLFDVLSEEEVMPLLQAAVQSGLHWATIIDNRGVNLWQAGQQQEQQIWAELGEATKSATVALILEGEPVGELRLLTDELDSALLDATAKLLGRTLNVLITGNLKRMLTTEIHTQVVNQSHQELVETNRRLLASEKKYRDLANNLDQRVQQRTRELKQMYARLIQQEKMASIGQMAAGIAHEINNPLGFVLSNLNSLKRYLGRYREMIDFHRHATTEGTDPARLKTLAEAEYKRLKLDVVNEDIEDIFSESINGAERVKKIVSDLKGFSHIDSLGEEPIDIHQEIERTLSVLAHEIPADTQIIRDFGTLPTYLCQGGLFGQLLFNLLRNALQSRQQGLEILIQTRWSDQRYLLTIADNGPGIPDEIRARIFEPFFTTRDVGQGTGLGLSVVYDIVNGWSGNVRVVNRPEGGASFTLNLPGERTDG